VARDTAAPRPRRRLSPDERRAELIDAAEDVVLGSGPDALSIERIAEHAGCSRNLAYTYFPNMEALLDAMRERQRVRLATAVLERIPRPAAFGPWIEAWIELVLDEAERRGPLFLLLADGDGFGRRRAMGRGAVALLELRLIDDLGLPPERARVRARLLSGLIAAAALGVAVDGSDRPMVQAELLELVRTGTTL
jgi:AcrR family transcriptional regulator